MNLANKQIKIKNLSFKHYLVDIVRGVNDHIWDDLVDGGEVRGRVGGGDLLGHLWVQQREVLR